jgi:hypothetical protein
MALYEIVHAEKLRLDEFVTNLDANIIEAVMKVEPQLTGLNKKQLLMSVGNDDKPLINKNTGTAYLSKAYGKRTGKNRPDLRLTGNYHKEMFTEMTDRNNYFQSSYDRKVEFLPSNYPNAHGIAPSNQPKAKELTTKAIGDLMKKKVFKS